MLPCENSEFVKKSCRLSLVLILVSFIHVGVERIDNPYWPRRLRYIYVCSTLTVVYTATSGRELRSGALKNII